jgi:hypothetical protein
MRWMCREPMQLRRPGMSSPDRREIARIHTGGVYDPQYSRVEINDKALRCGGAYQLAPWCLSISRAT